MSSEEYAAVALSRVPAIGPKLFRLLVRHFGSPAAVLEAGRRELLEIPGIAERTATQFEGTQHLREAERIGQFCTSHRVNVLFWSGEAYPFPLAKYDTAPAVLYHYGTTDFTNTRSVAIVGTRRMSALGAQQVERIIDPLAGSGVLVVSGLAYGVDITAHRRSMQFGLPTLAVLGSGLQHIYPRTHRKVALEMAERGGGLLTEYPPWQSPEREHFPARNRIVAMLADITVVVESDTSGGSMITANMAHGYGRRVGACPGRGGDSRTAGCNALIKSGRAHLIEGGDDILRLLNWQSGAASSQLRLFDLEPGERQLVDLLRTEESLAIDDLIRGMELPPTKLAGTLLTLEMKGIITALPGQRYRVASG
ncbi:DNA processing protein [Lewinella aquimaris]|uniref:DNA processing protein n=1 Tax=Neolewinella aquimaris TaxID=1835722 RepID=A0A840EDQ5_9BACT|nr:DNA-processing protein DprA [Neolewinella aquimaris]MBB4079066.1 DNA processing protein [Neolewinella aquimaris]